MHATTIESPHALRARRHEAEDRVDAAMEDAANPTMRRLVQIAACALGGRLDLSIHVGEVHSIVDCDRIDVADDALVLGDVAIRLDAVVSFAPTAAHDAPDDDRFDFVVDGRAVTLNAGDEHDPYGLLSFERACDAFLPLIDAGETLEITSSTGACATLPADAVALLEAHEAPDGRETIAVPLLGISIDPSSIGVRGIRDDGTTLTIASLDGTTYAFRRIGAHRG